MSRRLGAALVGLAAALCLLPAARAQTLPPPTSTVTLASQTPWVDPTAHSMYALRVTVHSDLPADQTQVLVQVYQRLTTRSEFVRTLSPDFSGYVIAHPINATLDTLKPDTSGTIEVDVPVTDTFRAGANNLLHLSSSGVYPVSVELKPVGGGKPLARMVTSLLYVASPPTTPPLHVAWVASVHAPTGDDQAAAHTTPLIDALADHPAVPVTFKVTPDTLVGLDRTNPSEVSRLGRSLAGREVLNTTWVPMSLPDMLDANLGDQASLSLTRGHDQLTTDLGTTVTDQTWVEDGPINQAALTFLRGSQFSRVVLPEADLDANPLRFTLAQPFVVAGTNRTPITAAVADAGLQAHFVNAGDQVLAAHQLLADLFQIYADEPATDRGVVIVTPPNWIPNAAFLAPWLEGLQSGPVLSALDLSDFFATVPPITGRDGEPLVRQVVGPVPDGSPLLADAERAARGQLDALATALPDNSTVYPRLERLLLQVPSSDLTAAGRRRLLDNLAAAVHQETSQVSIAGPKTITLTARTGRLPLNVVSNSDEPIEVLLRVETDKLEIPGAGSSGQATFPEQLHKGNNPVDLTVKARTPGAFSVRLTVLTPGGDLVMSQTRLTVQSTALSGVGVVLSVGAALFLAVWWGRHAWRSGRGTHIKRRPAP